MLLRTSSPYLLQIQTHRSKTSLLTSSPSSLSHSLSHTSRVSCCRSQLLLFCRDWHSLLPSSVGPCLNTTARVFPPSSLSHIQPAIRSLLRSHSAQLKPPAVLSRRQHSSSCSGFVPHLAIHDQFWPSRTESEPPTAGTRLSDNPRLTRVLRSFPVKTAKSCLQKQKPSTLLIWILWTRDLAGQERSIADYICRFSVYSNI